MVQGIINREKTDSKL